MSEATYRVIKRTWKDTTTFFVERKVGACPDLWERMENNNDNEWVYFPTLEAAVAHIASLVPPREETVWVGTPELAIWAPKAR